MAEGLKRMREQRFLDHIYEGYCAGQRYCFVLGAGASKASGIRTGMELMSEWQRYLKEKGDAYIEDCARELGLKPEDYSFIFEEGHDLKNADYFTLFDLRFAGKPNVAYAYLEKEMEGKYPSYGYYPLAMLLSNTENRLVITTNFDSLIEDALYTYTFKHPLVVGHESLASYIANDTRHPVVAKIHRDLLFQPLNRKADMDKLKDEWEKPLRGALSKYIPIVVGYAGGDRTFMSLLDRIELNGLYWCHLGEPSDEIKEIVAKQKGYLVKIMGFDEVMFQIGDRFGEEARFGDPCQYVREQAEERCGLYQKSFQEIKNKYEAQKDIPEAGPLSRDAQDDVNRLADAIDRYDSQRSGGDATAEKAKHLASEARREVNNGNAERAVELYAEAIALAPDNAEYYRGRSTALYNLKRYESALEDDTKAIALDSTKATYYYSRSVTLHAMKRYEESLKDRTKAIEMDPSNALYYQQQGVTLHEMKRYQEALASKTEAIKLNPSSATYYHSRGVTLHAMKRYKEALEDRTKAIERDPPNALYYQQRGLTLHAMKEYEDALQDITKAIEIDSANAVYYYSRSITFHAMERYEEALKDRVKAIELDPSNALYYQQRSVTLYEMKRYEECLRDDIKAIELDPSNARYYRSRAMTLRKLGREEEAKRDDEKAAELEK